MKKQILSLAILAAMTSSATYAAEKDDMDMSDPTDVYTSMGISYGTEGANLKGSLMLSEKSADSGSKTGIIFEAKNIFNEDADTPKFSHMVNHPQYGLVPSMSDTKSERSYRIRYGTISTVTGLGWSIDSVMGDHPFYGKFAVIQTGPVATIPVSDSLYIWPILYAGTVLLEDNMPQLIGEAQTNMSSSGIDFASTILTGQVYARYTINDNWWTLLSACYTTELQGKEWHGDVANGGLQMPSFQGEFTVAYQISKKQNLRMNYKTDNSDSTDDIYWLEYNHAF